MLGVPLIDVEEGVAGLWDRQIEILEAVSVENQVAIRSGHGLGKTFTMALIVIWWLYARKGRVVTTASSWHQVEKVLWSEIARLWSKTRVKLPGELMATELRVNRDWFAIGLSTDNPTSFQGQHDENLLVVVDEAPGVAEVIHTAIGSLATGEKNCIVMVGNPTERSGAFFEAFRVGKWKRIHLSCLEHPNVVHGREIIPGAVTRRWVEQQRARWGENSPVFASRVEGEFPKTSGSTVIALDQVELSQRQVEWAQYLRQMDTLRQPRIFGVDVARKGHNRTVVAVRRGDAIEAVFSWTGRNTMETVGAVRHLYAEYRPTVVVVDEVGVGGGVLDRLEEVELPVVGFHSGRTAQNKNLFVNRRSEHWWNLRERFESGRIYLPPDDGSPDITQLRADLTAPTYKINSSGKIIVERKEEMEGRGIDSPDFADAVAMAFIIDDEPEEEVLTFSENQDQTLFLPSHSEFECDMGQLPAGF